MPARGSAFVQFGRLVFDPTALIGYRVRMVHGRKCADLILQGDGAGAMRGDWTIPPKHFEAFVAFFKGFWNIEVRAAGDEESPE